MVYVCAPSDRRGFTLLETVVVLAIVGVILAVALPSYSNYTSNQRTLAAARTLRADLGVARQEAVTRRAPVTVSFATDDPRCGAGAYVLSHSGGIIKRTCLPPAVEWAERPDDPLVFESTGAPRATRTVSLRSVRTGRTHRVTATAGTGAVDSDGP